MVKEMTINKEQTYWFERTEFFQVNTYVNLETVVIEETNFNTIVCYEISSKLITLQLIL